jgi:hypothetical protein
MPGGTDAYPQGPQEELNASGRDRSSDDSMSARTLTVVLGVALGILVLLLYLLIR